MSMGMVVSFFCCVGCAVAMWGADYEMEGRFSGG